MDKAMQEVLDGLKLAIKAENEGQYFYKMAAQSTSDPKGKEVFNELAEEERLHESYLVKHFNSLKNTGLLDATVTLPEQSAFSEPHPIFSEKIQERIEDAHFEMTSLAVGIQLELNAINHYKAQAEKATSTEAKAFFVRLAEWEQTHYDTLSNQQEKLKEAYWTANSFSPF